MTENEMTEFKKSLEDLAFEQIMTLRIELLFEKEKIIQNLRAGGLGALDIIQHPDVLTHMAKGAACCCALRGHKGW